MRVVSLATHGYVLSGVSEIVHPLESLREEYMPFNMSDYQSCFTSMMLRASGLAVLTVLQIGETIFCLREGYQGFSFADMGSAFLKQLRARCREATSAKLEFPAISAEHLTKRPAVSSEMVSAVPLPKVVANITFSCFKGVCLVQFDGC